MIQMFGAQIARDKGFICPEKLAQDSSWHEKVEPRSAGFMVDISNILELLRQVFFLTNRHNCGASPKHLNGQAISWPAMYLAMVFPS